MAYTSDGDGLRQTRSQGGNSTDFLWSSVGGLPLLLDDGTNAYIYGVSSTPIAQIDDSTGGTSYLFGDLLGSVRLITGGTGAVTGASEFDTYGNRTDHTGLRDSAIGYTGNWTDPTTGLVYLRARDYDPTTASFITVDPLLDQTRMPYAYARNNPLQFTDPSGLDSLAPSDWQYWVIASSPLLSTIHNVSSRVESGTDLWSALVMTLDPAYAAIEGYSNYADHTQAGCPWYVRAGDLVEGIGGLVGTVGVAVGAAGGLSAGAEALPGGTSVNSAGSVSTTLTNEVAPAFEEALGGGRHAGFLSNYLDKPESEIEGHVPPGGVISGLRAGQWFQLRRR